MCLKQFWLCVRGYCWQPEMIHIGQFLTWASLRHQWVGGYAVWSPSCSRCLPPRALLSNAGAWAAAAGAPSAGWTACLEWSRSRWTAGCYRHPWEGRRGKSRGGEVDWIYQIWFQSLSARLVITEWQESVIKHEVIRHLTRGSNRFSYFKQLPFEGRWFSINLQTSLSRNTSVGVFWSLS